MKALIISYGHYPMRLPFPRWPNRFMELFISFFLILFPLMLFPQEKIIAHRGASSIAPENTIAAFSRAIELGVGCIEVDVRFSKDDSTMLIHDKTLDRTTSGSGSVNQYSYQQLKEFSAGYADKFGPDFINEKIPTLFEVLSLAKGKVKVSIDVKNSPEMPIIEQIEKTDMMDDVFLMSYNVEKLKRIKNINPDIKTVLLKNTLTSVDIEVAEEIGAFGVSTSYVSPLYLVRKAHDKNLELWMGIVSDPAKAESLFAQNVDAILTNHPQLMTMDSERQIVVFPNPFFDEIKITLINPENVQSVFVLNTNGKKIHEFAKPNQYPLIWRPGKNITKGLYLVCVISDERIIFEKILYFD